MSVVATGEFYDLVAARDTSGQAQHRHGGFSARVDQADLLDGHPLDDLGCKINFGYRRRAVWGSAPSSISHPTHEVGMGMAEQHRTPGADQVDQFVAVDVIQVRAAGTSDESWRPAHRSERAIR